MPEIESSQSKSTTAIQQNIKSQKRFYIIVVISVALVAILIGLVPYLIRRSQSKYNNPRPTTSPSPTAKPAARITSLVATTALDSTGAAKSSLTTFSAQEKSIFVVAELQNSLSGTKISYLRTLNGVYLDAKEATLSKDGITHFSFEWNLKAGATGRASGLYNVTVYLNGARQKTINYTVK